MSVIGYPQEKFNLLAKALILRATSGNRDVFFNPADEARLAKAKQNTFLWKGYEENENKWRENQIGIWCDHLYIANQVCFHVQCQDQPMTGLDRLGDLDSCGMPKTSDKFLYDELKSIRYNLYTNGGSIFLGPDDYQRLEDIIANLAANIIREHDRVEQGIPGAY